MADTTQKEKSSMNKKKKILIGIGIFILIYFVLSRCIMNSGVGDEYSQSINETKPNKYISGLENRRDVPWNVG